MAVVGNDHLQHIRMLSKKCNFLFHQISIEKSNFQSVLHTMDEMYHSGVSICAIHITGKLSALDISLLIDKIKGGAVRLLIKFYPLLLYCLQMTGKLNSVLLPPSLRQLQHLHESTYEPSSFLATIHKNAELLFSDHLGADKFKQEVSALRTRNQQMIAWKDKEKTWRASSMWPQSRQTELYRIIVTDSDELVRQYYTRLVSNDHAAKLLILDCREAQVERVIEGLKRKHDDGFAEGLDTQSKGEVPCIVILNAHLLSDALRKFIAANVWKASYKLIMVVNQFNPDYAMISIPAVNAVLQVESSRTHKLCPTYNRLSRQKNGSRCPHMVIC